MSIIRKIVLNIDIFQILCGNYDPMKNPKGVIIVYTEGYQDVEFSIDITEDRFTVSAKKGKVRVFDREARIKILKPVIV